MPSSHHLNEVDADSPIAAITAFDVATAEAGDDLPRLARRFRANDVGALLIPRRDGSCGIVTERDVVDALADDDDNSWAADCMTRDVIAVPSTMSIADAAEVLLTAGVRHLVVEHENGSLGVASMRDMLRPLLDSADDGETE